MGITERIDNITLVRDFTPVLPAPKSVKIELSPRCNYRCGFCALRCREEQPRTDMKLDFFKRIVSEMHEAGVEEIGIFYLGESLMAPDLAVKAVEHCKAIGVPYVFLTTNGSLATPKTLKRLFKAGLDSLKFSVNASNETQFKEIMGVSPRWFWKAIDNLQQAQAIRDEVGSKCGIYASSIMYDGEQQARMEEFLASSVRPFVDEHYWLPLYSMGSVAVARERELGYRPTAGNQGRLGAMREPLPCWSAFTEGHVRADGGLSLCCFDADGRFVVGDLTKQSFMDAWNSPEFVKVREAHLRKDVTGTVCEACVAYQ